MRTLRFLALAVITACLLPAFAQSPTEVQQQRLIRNHKLIFFGDDEEPADSSAYLELINRFYMDQFRHSQDPRAPYFMLMSRSGRMAMGVGGVVKAVGYYDWDGTISGSDFSPYNIPIPMDPSQVNSLQTSMGKSSLFFSIFGNDRRFGNYSLYLEAKFSGGNDQHFKLSKAYATVGDWTLGYTKSTFVDPASQPSTVESEGPNSEVDDTRFLLRYMHSLPHGFTVAVSAETPQTTIAPTTLNAQGSVYMPDLSAFVQYGTPKQHIRLSGIVKGMRYRNLVANANGYATGWGVNLTTVFSPVRPLTVYAAVNTGAGISTMVNDLSCGDASMLPLADAPGKMYAPRSYGWYAALQYNFSPSVFSTVIFSQERMLPKHNAVYGGDQYKYGLYGTANVFWNVTPRWQLGAELNIGKRANIDGTHRLAYRAGLLAEFSF